MTAPRGKTGFSTRWLCKLRAYWAGGKTSYPDVGCRWGSLRMVEINPLAAGYLGIVTRGRDSNRYVTFCPIAE